MSFNLFTFSISTNQDQLKFSPNDTHIGSSGCVVFVIYLHDTPLGAFELIFEGSYDGKTFNASLEVQIMEGPPEILIYSGSLLFLFIIIRFYEL